MKVLIACEESQTVCEAFRALGHEAYSCDIQEPSGGKPEWHILGDALEAIKGGTIVTMDGQVHDVGKWDMLIAHPPCTYLTSASAIRLFNRDHTVKDCVRSGGLTCPSTTRSLSRICSATRGKSGRAFGCETSHR